MRRGARLWRADDDGFELWPLLAHPCICVPAKEWRYNIGAFRIRIGFGVYYTIIIVRNPQNPILIIKALIL